MVLIVVGTYFFFSFYDFLSSFLSIIENNNQKYRKGIFSIYPVVLCTREIPTKNGRKL